MSTPTRDVLEGLANLLAGAGLGVYNPAGELANTDTGIMLNGLAPSPDKQYVLSLYGPGGDYVNLPIDRVAIQVRVRGDADPRTEMDMRDSMHALLQGRRRAVLGSVTLLQLSRTSLYPPTQDAAGRWESTSNYYSAADVPASTNRNLSY